MDEKNIQKKFTSVRPAPDHLILRNSGEPQLVAASRRSTSHPTDTQVRSFLSHLFAPMRAPRPHREGACGD
jgi:hypothetical protein